MSDNPRWVRNGELARSSRPGYPDRDVGPESVAGWLRQVRGMGIRSVVVLLTDEEISSYYSRLPDGLLGLYRQSGLRVKHIPIRDPAHYPEGYEELRENLGRIYEAFKELPKPVLIHCSAGCDRTGRAVDWIQERLASAAADGGPSVRP